MPRVYASRNPPNGGPYERHYSGGSVSPPLWPDRWTSVALLPEEQVGGEEAPLVRLVASKAVMALDALDGLIPVTAALASPISPLSPFDRLCPVAWRRCACGTPGVALHRRGSGPGPGCSYCCSSCISRVLWLSLFVLVRSSGGSPCALGAGFLSGRTLGDLVLGAWAFWACRWEVPLRRWAWWWEVPYGRLWFSLVRC